MGMLFGRDEYLSVHVKIGVDETAIKQILPIVF